MATCKTELEEYADAVIHIAIAAVIELHAGMYAYFHDCMHVASYKDIGS